MYWPQCLSLALFAFQMHIFCTAWMDLTEILCWLLKKRVKQGFFFWTTFITTGNFWYCFFVPVFLCSFQPVMSFSVVHLVWVFILIVMTSVMTHLASWFFCESSSWILTLLEVHFFMAFRGCFSSPSFFFVLWCLFFHWNFSLHWNFLLFITAPFSMLPSSHSDFMPWVVLG